MGFLGVVPDMTLGCCMDSEMQWVSRYMESTWIALDHLEFQTWVVRFAKGLCSAVAGRSLNMAYQTFAHGVWRH